MKSDMHDISQMIFEFDFLPEEDACVHVLFSFDVEVEEDPVQEKAPPCIKPAAKKRNKIINNSYKSGENLKGDDYRFETELRVDPNYASSNLSHIYDAENNILYRKVQDEVLALIDANNELAEMLSEAKPKKFNREKVNRMFQIIHEHFEKNHDIRDFGNLIYIFDNVSNLSGLKYSSLYDLLDQSYQQMLLVELDKTYDILKHSGKSNTLF